MKTLIGGLFTMALFFTLGAVTYPKTERVYKCTQWKPIDHISVPVNKVKNDLNRFESEITEQKIMIQEVLTEIEKDTTSYAEAN